MSAVFHIAHHADWTAADLDGEGYAPATFADEGFVHCSTATQVLPSAERHFPGRHQLVLVALAPDALGTELRYEHAPSVGDAFPHLYRRIVAADVLAVAPFGRPGGEGYAFPEELAAWA